MDSTVAASLVALAFLVAPSARADDDAETDAVRRDVDALVRRIEQGPQPDADSPTAIVNRLLAAGEPKLRPVLAEAWRIAAARSDVDDDREASVRWAVRFLYGLEHRSNDNAANSPSIVGADAVVRVRAGDGAGPLHWGNGDRPPVPTFAQLVEGGSLRVPGRPRAADLLAEVSDVAANEVGEGEREDFARALGEACVSDPASRGRLLELLADARFDATLVTAAAWSKSPDAVAAPGSKLAPLASASLAIDDAKEPFAAACRGLAHADRAALMDEIAKMHLPEWQDAAFGVLELDVAEAFFATWLEHAADPPARVPLLRRLAAVLRDRDESVTVGRMPNLLAAELDRGNGATRAAAIAAAEAFLGGGSRPCRRSTSWSDGPSGEAHAHEWSRHSEGEELRPYSEGASALRVLGSDLGAGRIAFAERRPSAFDEQTQPPTVHEARVVSDVPPADEFVRAPEPEPKPGERATISVTPALREFSDAHLRLGGEFAAAGLSLKVTNVGDSDVSVDPIALRYATAEIADERVTAMGEDPREYLRMNLVFGRLPHAAVVDAKVLVVLAPGTSFSWTTPVRPQDRDVDHVVVSLEYGIRVRGTPPAPLVTHFRDVWVK